MNALNRGRHVVAHALASCYEDSAMTAHLFSPQGRRPQERGMAGLRPARHGLDDDRPVVSSELAEAND